MWTRWHKHTGCILCTKSFQSSCVIQTLWTGILRRGTYFVSSHMLYKITESREQWCCSWLSFTHQHSAIFQTGHCESGWLSYRVNGTAGKQETWEENQLTSFLQSFLVLCLLPQTKNPAEAFWPALALSSLLSCSKCYHKTSPHPYFQLLSPNTINRAAGRRTTQVSLALPPGSLRGVRTKEIP